MLTNDLRHNMISEVKQPVFQPKHEESSAPFPTILSLYIGTTYGVRYINKALNTVVLYEVALTCKLCCFVE